MAPGSEAPSEMMWYLPKFKLINTAEDATHTMHNLYTLRGARPRRALVADIPSTRPFRCGGPYEVQITMHHWPTWGNAEITQLIKVQRDTYKFMHDQTLHYANMGYTMDELPGLVTLRGRSRTSGRAKVITAPRATTCGQFTTSTWDISTATRRL